MKHQFSMFYRYKKFHTKETKVENFIKGEENIYYSRPKLPPYMLLEVMIYGVIAVGLFLFSLFLNRGGIYRIEKDKLPPGEASPLFINSKEYKILKLERSTFKDYLFNLLSGKTREIERSGYQYPGIVYLDDEDIIAAPKKNDVLYIPPVECFPEDIRGYDLLAYFSGLSGKKGKAVKESIKGIGIDGLLKKRFWKLEKEERLRVILEAALLVEVGVYFIYNVNREMPGKGLVILKDKLEELAKKGGAVLLLTTQPLAGDMQLSNNKYYNENNKRWLEQVELVRGVLEKEKAIKEPPVS